MLLTKSPSPHATPRHATPVQSRPRLTKPRHTSPSPAMPCQALPCLAKPCLAVPCLAAPLRATPSHSFHDTASLTRPFKLWISPPLSRRILPIQTSPDPPNQLPITVLRRIAARASTGLHVQKLSAVQALLTRQKPSQLHERLHGLNHRNHLKKTMPCRTLPDPAMPLLSVPFFHPRLNSGSRPVVLPQNELPHKLRMPTVATPMRSTRILLKATRTI
jgi:hypothetical protein